MKIMSLSPWLPVTFTLILLRYVALTTSLQNWTNNPGRSKHLACFYGSWAVYRPERAKVDIEDLDAHICTHLVYSFGGITPDGRMKALDPYNDLYDNYGKGAYTRFNFLRAQNPDLRTLLAIGGWNEGSVKYSSMVRSKESRWIFISSVIDFCVEFGFTGVIMDWEYPTQRGGLPDDRINFVHLIEEMHQSFPSYGLSISAAFSAGKDKIDDAYYVDGLIDFLEFFYIMTFDFYGSWHPYTCHHSPLYGRPQDPWQEQLLNTNFSINYWLSKGVPATKIAMAIPLYGRSFTLADRNKYGAYAPSAGPGREGPYTRTEGQLSYQEICESFSTQEWNVVRDPYFSSPFAVNGDQWVGYDDRESILTKIQYGQSMQLGGIMVWAIDMDDVYGHCHGVKFPLLTVINEALGRSYVTKTPNLPSSTRKVENKGQLKNTLLEATSLPLAYGDQCNDEGFRKDLYSCRKFYRCVYNGDHVEFYEFYCPAELVFSVKSSACDWSDNVPECSNFVR